ncbi:MAG TPA: DUF5695 domain-containing protein [Puia sp.]|jgi:hypothetical protein
MDKRVILLLFQWALTVSLLHAQQPAPVSAASDKPPVLRNEAFTIQRSGHGIGGLWKTGDRYQTDYIRKGKMFGEVVVRFRTPGGILDSLKTDSGSTHSLRLSQTFNLQGEKLFWTISLANTGARPLTIEDLALPLPYNSGGGENPTEIFEQRVVKHHFISGNNSFIFWQRPTGVGPYLLLLPLHGTSLEYFSTNAPGEGRDNRGAFQAFIHASHTSHAETRGTWRQPVTTTTIPSHKDHTDRFVFRWAKDYTDIRRILVEEGLIDIQVMPGMTIPTDLDATIALNTKQKITALTAEFPEKTIIRPVSLAPHSPLTQKGYKLKFSHPGENRITIQYGPNYKTYLEFFVTEPLETLYKKRAAFIVNRQQHKDPSKWYDGLFSVYDMKHHQLRGPDNPDYFDTSRLSYVLTCDDPALCKAPFVAAKNVFYPDQHEIDAVEYYIEHFVWGKLQRTDKETPYPYGVYGTPNWKVNRDTARRMANLKDPNRDKMHVWRSYDYPHIMMLYYEMYKIATLYPGRTHYLDAKGYLERAMETAKAFFTYPYEILPWYETYKWGCYNELLIVDLAKDLDKAGFHKDARFLRNEWEKKVKYFLYDDPYPFRSEYAIDATAFESSHALARYALLNTLQPDSNLWYDKNLKKWYSHPHIEKEDAIRFMDRQIQANMALRGCIEPAYYYLGSDYRGRSDNFTLTYMTQMGGWSILDYGLHFAKDPAGYIRLGYAAYLAPFALMNTGTPSSGYGFWYPGKDNDGASGWAFESQQYANTWIQKPQGRGPWYYDGEVDLGYGGATRMAATVITDDPVFGLVAYGGSLDIKGGKGNAGTLYVTPKDGLRRRLYYRRKDGNFDIELNRDGFAKDQPLIIGPDSLVFRLEDRSGDAHTTSVLLKGAHGTTTVDIPVGPGATTAVSLHRP